jgi:hypothetical protein
VEVAPNSVGFDTSGKHSLTAPRKMTQSDVAFPDPGPAYTAAYIIAAAALVAPPRRFPSTTIITSYEHLHGGAANPQIAYDMEIAKTSISTAESSRKSAHKSITFCVYRSFIAANLSDLRR